MKKFDVYDDTFQNLTEKNMKFEMVFERIKKFMENDPRGNYRLMIGTDSQVHPRHTLFITGIIIQRVGKGVWACIRKASVARKMTNLRERISYETTLTEEIAYMFTLERKNQLINIVLPYLYQGATLKVEGHLDIGKGRKNKTREYVQEMTKRIQSIGMEPKIKPDSIAASCYANRYTK